MNISANGSARFARPDRCAARRQTAPNRRRSPFNLALTALLVLAAASRAGAWTYGATSRVWIAGGPLAELGESPALGADGTIYLGARDGRGDARLYAFNMDGSTNWSCRLWGNRVSAGAALGEDGTIYVGSSSQTVYNLGYVYAFNGNGTIRRTWNTGNWIDPCPSLGPTGGLYVACADSRLYRFRADGGTDWSLNLGGWLRAAPAVGYDGTVYQARLYPIPDNKLYAVTPQGAVAQTWTVAHWLNNAPAIGWDGTLYLGCEDGNFYAFGAGGSTQWVSRLGDAARGGAALGADGTVYAGCDDGKLYALDPADGSVRHTWQTGADIRSTPAVGADGTIYVGSEDANFYAFNPDGTTNTIWVTGGPIRSSPTIGPDGMVYVGSGDGRLYAFMGTGGALADSAWPKFNHDIANTGRSAPQPPADVSASDFRWATQVRVSWAPSLFATGYEVWRATNALESSAAKIGTVDAAPYWDTSGERGRVYVYWIKASSHAGASRFSAPDTGSKRLSDGVLLQVR